MHRISAKCGSTRGLAIEGNATDVYNSIMHPPGTDRPGSKNAWTTMQLGSDVVVTPPLRDLFDSIAPAGNFLVSTRSWWGSYLGSYCSTPRNGTPKYCGTERFRCWVRANAALPGEMPSIFDTEDCRPGTPVITGAVVTDATVSPAVVSVSFDAEHHTDEFELLASSGSITDVAGDRTRFDGVRLPPCETHTLRVRAWNAHGSATSPAFSFTPMNEVNCVPEEVTGASVSDLGNGLFLIAHAPAAQATEYRIEYGTDSNLSRPSQSPWTSATSHQVPLLPNPFVRNAYYRVVAQGPFGITVGPILEHRTVSTICCREERLP
jgi:hypothetical protein